ncbi:hypothetical protein ADK67_14875 [Saccharothrix sp. NRRL B-16348]|uniref:hypothetical protein n=1 Tax=Saccharothrix sp. NRRL B-16348 TaxID=1415542 RepID=UPI0006ADE360|nr:hypothetical protein [Saccharothrix sp. NRRL B-16348]KOX27095.1 hypothetical protein ADK67_14875 [Saccharothrix sp. NRRL B-16348]
MRRRRRAPAAGTLGTSGWLFAELALLLVVVVIGSEISDHRPAASAPVAPPSAVGSPQGLSLTTKKFLMPATPDAEAASRFRDLLTAEIGPDAKVGLVLLFGVSRTGSLGDGAVVSEHLLSLIVPAGIPQLASAVDIRAYIGSTSDGAGGDVLVELFLMNGPS